MIFTVQCPEFFQFLAEIRETVPYLCSLRRNWGSPKEVIMFSLSFE